ncbi:MAG: tRNA glutamyl-Q(34) synthetase GluQRS [Ectothiorhodospiraceae bacterium]|nr:tRNA glutamyl-Q(34) synthetase GluQRS [Ectothiorhodospiraceae bacterium]
MASTPETQEIYRGRFAPSPTGPLHFGSLIAATGSYLEARTRGGEWLLRIDDIDPPREQPGASEEIPRTLELFGFQWDGPVHYQSSRTERYREVVQTLIGRELAYGCGCTRKDIAAAGKSGPNGLVYPGTCRNGLAPGRRTRALRVRTEHQHIRFDDLFQGIVRCDLEGMLGDFVIRRADGYYAYHLAAAVDDGDSGITHVIRGHDLLWCTPPQLYLQQLLRLPQPRYGHLPVAVNAQGQKLSKQTFAPALDVSLASTQLWQALDFLLQSPPEALAGEPLDIVWEWALAHWDPAPLRHRQQAPAPDA